jgi:hypothetical protein
VRWATIKATIKAAIQLFEPFTAARRIRKTDAMKFHEAADRPH